MAPDPLTLTLSPKGARELSPVRVRGVRRHLSVSHLAEFCYNGSWMGRDGRGYRFRIFLSGGGLGPSSSTVISFERLIPVLLLPSFGPSLALPHLMGTLPCLVPPGSLSFPLRSVFVLALK